MCVLCVKNELMVCRGCRCGGGHAVIVVGIDNGWFFEIEIFVFSVIGWSCWLNHCD